MSRSATPDVAEPPPVPVPVDLDHPSIGRRVQRALLLVRSLLRHLTPILIRRFRGRSVSQLELARALRPIFEEMGATFLKYGQMIASSPTLFGEDLANEFRSCLDVAPPVAYDHVRGAIQSELGASIETLFASFDPEPLGRASLAVVHKAVTRDGRTVAVKVLRPAIDEIIACDLALMEPFFDFIGAVLGPEAAGALSDVLGGLRLQLSEELNLRNEAATLVYFKDLPSAAHIELVVVPQPYHDLSSRRVLTMEFLDGVPVDDLARIEEFGVDPRPVVEQVVKAWFMTAVRGGLFHGDVHAGNIMILRDGRIALLDWGIVGRLDPELHHVFRQLLAFALGDDDAWEDVATFFIGMYANMANNLQLDQDLLLGLFRQQARVAMNQPFGEVSLSDLFTMPQQEINKVVREKRIEKYGQEKLPFRARYKMWKSMRSSVDDDTRARIDHGMVLLGKQLAYFERYGKMYLADVPLLHDPVFFGGLLKAPPLHRGATAVATVDPPSPARPQGA
jgi:predicted unusual protein kinase regulating ubiquinone biosynthesis (AarF/ABC1/UbiB family)